MKQLKLFPLQERRKLAAMAWASKLIDVVSRFPNPEWIVNMICRNLGVDARSGDHIATERLRALSTAWGADQ